MPRNLILTAVAAALVCIAAMAWAQETERPSDKNTDFIKADVRGILRFEAGHGYFITVKSDEKPERETRIWLLFGEDKVTARQLEPLVSKQVLAQGNLEQMPEEVHASVPPNGMYLRHFQIKGAGEK